MNLSDVKIRVKRQFGDESGVQITDDDITRWVNDAQRDIVMRNEEVLQESAIADTVAGQLEYSLPANLFILRAISARQSLDTPYYPLDGKSMQEFDAQLYGWDGPGPLNGTYPQVYHVYNHVLKLWPIPSVSVTGGLKIYYSRRPVDVINDSDSLDLPIEYHSAVVQYCLTQAYELDEDLQSAAYKTQQFQDTLDANRGRENRTNVDTYPVITVLEDDAW